MSDHREKFTGLVGEDFTVEWADFDKEPLVYRQPSPSLTVRLPRESCARLDAFTSREGRRASVIVREALDEYLTRHAG